MSGRVQLGKCVRSFNFAHAKAFVIFLSMGHVFLGFT